MMNLTADGMVTPENDFKNGLLIMIILDVIICIMFFIGSILNTILVLLFFRRRGFRTLSNR